MTIRFRKKIPIVLSTIAAWFHVKSQKVIAGMTYGGSTVAASGGVIAWLNGNAQAVGALVGLGGFVVAVIGLVIGWMYKHKHYKLAEKKTNREIEQSLKKLLEEIKNDSSE